MPDALDRVASKYKGKKKKGGKVPKKELAWRERQKRGAIMRPSTFKAIEAKAKKKYGSAEIAKKVAGAAYQKTAKAKYRDRKK